MSLKRLPSAGFECLGQVVHVAADATVLDGLSVRLHRTELSTPDCPIDLAVETHATQRVLFAASGVGSRRRIEPGADTVAVVERSLVQLAVARDELRWHLTAEPVTVGPFTGVLLPSPGAVQLDTPELSDGLDSGPLAGAVAILPGSGTWESAWSNSRSSGLAGPRWFRPDVLVVRRSDVPPGSLLHPRDLFDELITASPDFARLGPGGLDALVQVVATVPSLAWHDSQVPVEAVANAVVNFPEVSWQSAPDPFQRDVWHARSSVASAEYRFGDSVLSTEAGGSAAPPANGTQDLERRAVELAELFERQASGDDPVAAGPWVDVLNPVDEFLDRCVNVSSVDQLAMALPQTDPLIRRTLERAVERGCRAALREAVSRIAHERGGLSWGWHRHFYGTKIYTTP
jgi:hypothetical protein